MKQTTKAFPLVGGLVEPGGTGRGLLAGRFPNVDPVIQDAGFSQNYNRYSYCLNNPLKYTDPSGNQIAPRQYREEGPDRASGGGGGFYGNGLSTPHLDQARELNMAQDASGGWRYDSGSNGYYNLFSYETGWGAASDPIASYGASLPVNIDIPTISFGRKGRLNGVWYQTVSLKGNYKDWVDGVKSPGAYVNVINKFRAIDPQGQGGNVDFGNYKISSNELKGRLQDFADQTGYDVTVVGGDRSAARNASVGGSKGSRHLYGDAADIVVRGTPNRDVAIQAQGSGLFNTTIYYPSYNTPGALPPHVHVDLNPGHDNVLMIYKIVNGSNMYLPWNP